ncbi:unnamed protein product [Clonostachys solani]|uniref:Uncharacterized protein n=1 Tax=Clonostachys solani TaxID=160281 RepID=A0A9N9Z1U3_9HYPO|nr:unnamed protein product [Clonostachys solani]
MLHYLPTGLRLTIHDFDLPRNKSGPKPGVKIINPAVPAPASDPGKLIDLAPEDRVDMDKLKVECYDRNFPTSEDIMA